MSNYMSIDGYVLLLGFFAGVISCLLTGIRWVLPLTHFIFPQKCQGVPFSPICQNALLLQRPHCSVDPICPQPTHTSHRVIIHYSYYYYSYIHILIDYCCYYYYYYCYECPTREAARAQTSWPPQRLTRTSPPPPPRSCVYIYIYIFMYVCIYTYMYIHKYIYIYIFMYM